MTYKVLIAMNHPKIECEWWSDQKELPSFCAAQRHRNVVAERWNDCDTAILAKDGRLLAFRESIKEQAALEAMRHER
jgi:hypothetical protein